MILIKSERVVLKRMRHEHLFREDIPNFEKLFCANLIAPDLTDEYDAFGNQIQTGKYHLTDDYWRYIEQRREKILLWLVPVAISAAALLVSFVALFK